MLSGERLISVFHLSETTRTDIQFDNLLETTSHLKIKILGQDQGGVEFQAADILQYFEDLELGSNADIGPKDYFEIACIKKAKLYDIPEIPTIL